MGIELAAAPKVCSQPDENGLVQADLWGLIHQLMSAEIEADHFLYRPRCSIPETFT
jgi:hypothetical protein